MNKAMTDMHRVPKGIENKFCLMGVVKREFGLNFENQQIVECEFWCSMANVKFGLRLENMHHCT